MKIAVADADANVRRAALGVLPSLPLSDAVKVQNLTAVIRSGTVADQQAGFEVLGTLKSSEAEKALASFFDELAAGKMPPAVQIDLVDAMQANGAPALEARLDAYRKTKGVDTVALAFRDALLQGGSVPPWPGAVCRASGSAVHPLPHGAQCWLGRRSEPDGCRDSADARADPRVPARAERPHRGGVRHGGDHAQERHARGRDAARRNGHRRRHRRGHAAGRADGSRRRRSPSARTPSPRCRPSASSSSRATCGTWWPISGTLR